MGNRVSLIWNRLFDFPVKRKPICFFRQEDFSSTGEYVGDVPSVNFPNNIGVQYDGILEAFYNELLRLRSERHLRGDCSCEEDVAKNFPGWDGTTVANLHSLYLLFDIGLNNLLDFDDMEAILDSLGDCSPLEHRRERFEKADVNGDCWMSRQEFLQLIYSYNEPEEGQELGALALRCKEIAQRILFVSSLTLGEQLEYGLF